MRKHAEFTKALKAAGKALCTHDSALVVGEVATRLLGKLAAVKPQEDLSE